MGIRAGRSSRQFSEHLVEQKGSQASALHTEIDAQDVDVPGIALNSLERAYRSGHESGGEGTAFAYTKL